MDKRKSFLNVSSSIFSRIILLLAAFVVRRLLIQRIGNDVNGLDSLYTSIIGMLSVAELGVGSAITFSMYKPIVQGDQRLVSALYFLYARLYRIIGIVIFLAGLVVMPFLPDFIGDYTDIKVNVYLTFFLTLVSVVITYLYSAKSSLIEAHKDNYVTTIILTVSRLVTYGFQILCILLWQSFTVYLICQIAGTLAAWLMTDAVARKRYKGIIRAFVPLEDNTKSEIVKNIKAMFMHRIGAVLVGSIDGIIISAFIGVVILGKYSNYTYIGSAMAGTIALFFTPLTSTVGHLCAEGNKDRIKRCFDFFYCMNYALGVVFFLGYYAVIDDVVRLVFGSGLEVGRGIVTVITVNQFSCFMRNSSLLFRDASGTFYNDRWKPAAEGMTNLVLSLLFVILFPEQYKVVGVIVATIITNLLICDIIEPYVVYKHVFVRSPKEYYIRNYTYIGIFTCALFFLSHLTHEAGGIVSGILRNGIISVGVSLCVLGTVAVFDKMFRNALLRMRRLNIDDSFHLKNTR